VDENALTWDELQAHLDPAPPDASVRHPADKLKDARASEWRATGLSPEEWAAHNAHEIVLFSFDEFRYDDPDLDAWVQRLGRILFTRGGVDVCRRRFLTTEQRLAYEAREQEPL
jgi:hypothetical protein